MGWRSNPGGGKTFGTCPDKHRRTPNLLYNAYRVYFPGGKQPGRGSDHLPPAGAEGRKRASDTPVLWQVTG